MTSCCMLKNIYVVYHLPSYTLYFDELLQVVCWYRIARQGFVIPYLMHTYLCVLRGGVTMRTPCVV